MKIRFMLGIIFSSFLVGQLQAMLTYSFTGLPSGSYQQSCRNIKVKIEGDGLDLTRVVTAECQDAQGKWKRATIKVPVVATQEVVLENNNGQLKVVEQPVQSHSPYPLLEYQQPLQ